ncbi:hypothetical protein [Variovorax sp. LjRoot175]|uniref:hypothetical protein n=1 Tax=Variovorax sp. LjRoot175 TaxID=3342276 RepID=UPI003F512F74
MFVMSRSARGDRQAAAGRAASFRGRGHEHKDVLGSVYRAKSPESLGWSAPHLLQALRYVEKAAPHKDAPSSTWGGGESTLVDDLLADGYRKVTVLDVSTTALEVARQRLGARAWEVSW